MSKAETVYVTTMYKTHENVYHSDKDCVRFKNQDAVKEKPKSELRADARLCKDCAGEQSVPDRQETKTCPYCEDEVKRLPNHLPNCEAKP
jgi:uncharacterized CHY-type Zn-finger protein